MVGFIILKKKAGDFYRGIPRGIAGVPGLTFRKMLAACVGRAMGDFCLSYMSTEEAHSRGGGWMVEGDDPPSIWCKIHFGVLSVSSVAVVETKACKNVDGLNKKNYNN